MKNQTKKMLKIGVISAMLFLSAFQYSSGFCGFYVAKAGANVFNNKSEVILVRDGIKTTITMRNDFKGKLSRFAMVVPVPVVLKRTDIQIKENSLFNNLDAYSAPRLVEYFDNNPCQNYVYSDKKDMIMLQNMPINELAKASPLAKKYKVVIEAQYSIDEYEIIILSAKESGGLEAWLNDNGYSVPQNAKEVLTPYIKDNMKFFAVKVNLEKAKQLADGYLRPIQISFESKKFMLPIRLGMANAEKNTAQDLIIYAFTKNGRVESANYRTIEMPTARKIPTFLKADFNNFYKETFDRKYKFEGRNAVFLEYAWNVSPNWGIKCDPCVGNPPVVDDLINSGINWLTPNQNFGVNPNNNVFFTRLHLRYDRENFPADLTFIETPNQTQYQVRQIITNAANGEFDCEKGLGYLKDLKNRRLLELQEMQALSGRMAKSYPFYVELGSGKIQQIDIPQYEEEEEELFPFGLPKNKPTFLLLPLLVLAVIALIWGAKFWVKLSMVSKPIEEDRV